MVTSFHKGRKMIKSENLFWGRNVVPNLPPHLVPEYMWLLGEYAECRSTLAKPSFKTGDSELWCFPFFELDEPFDHADYDKWVEMVEQDMMTRHNLTEHHFVS
jgi:hypothetical protein